MRWGLVTDDPGDGDVDRVDPKAGQPTQLFRDLRADPRREFGGGHRPGPGDRDRDVDPATGHRTVRPRVGVPQGGRDGAGAVSGRRDALDPAGRGFGDALHGVIPDDEGAPLPGFVVARRTVEEAGPVSHGYGPGRHRQG